MNIIKGLIGAFVGALVGAGIWGLVSYQSGYEVGWIAWGVGALTGLGMLLGARDSSDVATGGLAAVIALFGVICGKYFANVATIDDYYAEEGFSPDLDDEGVLSFVADQIVEEREAAGQIIQWPDEDNWGGGLTAADYPEDIWQEAQARWDSWPPSYQNDFRRWAEDEYYTGYSAGKWIIGAVALPYSFQVIDVLWLFLALGSAYKLGAGITGGDD